MISAPHKEIPKRAICSFHRDALGHWFAKLECGHHQHTRHDPPWINRAWVESTFGRMAMLGQLLSCPQCAPWMMPVAPQSDVPKSDIPKSDIPRPDV